MSPRSRPRIPHIFGVIQLLFRFVVLVTALVDLVLLCRCTIKYSKRSLYPRSKVFGGAISMATLDIIASLVEIPPLMDKSHRFKRPGIGYVGILDLAAFVVGIYAIFEIIFSDYPLGNASLQTLPPWVGLQHQIFKVTIVLVVETFFSVAIDCVGICRQVRKLELKDPSVAVAM